MVRLCRFEDVLLADEHRLHNPADAQDRMVLGIQGAFNEFELSMILDRMQQGLRQKAQRGEQYDGYVVHSIGLDGKNDAGRSPEPNESGWFNPDVDGDLRLDTLFPSDDVVDDAASEHNEQ